MAKKNELNIDTVEQSYNFPSVLIDGVEGVTIKAKSTEEAEEKLKQLLNNK